MDAAVTTIPLAKLLIGFVPVVLLLGIMHLWSLNALLAVGLISLPGMMTGQILSGIDPLIAARYQIMVMCMIFASGGLAAACYLTLQRNAGK